MRVAMMIDTLRIGGAQKLVTRFVSAVSKRNVESTVISFRDNAAAANLDAIHSAGANLMTFPSRSLLDPGRLMRLIRFLRAGKFDLIHTHLSYANILGCLAGYYAGIPVIATLHSTGHDLQRDSGLVTRLEEVGLRYFARRIIAVGYTVAAAYQPRLSSRTLDVIPNGVPIPQPISMQVRQSLRHEIAADENCVVLIAVGRFAEAKGYEDMIEAFAILHQRNLQTVLAIAGVGGLFDKIKRKISEMQLQDSIHCLGERNDISQLLAASDIYVSSSHREGLPVALLEAMMAGLPIVGTSVGDIPRVVTPETGIIVPPHEPACLADALYDLVSAPEKARILGNAARARAMQEYSLDTWVNRTVSLYEETVSASKG
ncbi:MAG: glycosyltransferase [Chloroflexi bacterium]|nr:MAG: glycosyltransferase [Chloroflexota bacterium]